MCENTPNGTKFTKLQIKSTYSVQCNAINKGLKGFATLFSNWLKWVVPLFCTGRPKISFI